MLGRQVVVVGPGDVTGCRRLLAAGASRVLVIGEGVAAEPGIDVHPASERLPLRSASVDVVVAASAASLEPAALEILIGEAARVLRPGGLLALVSRPEAPRREAMTKALAERFAATRWLAVRRLDGVTIAPIAGEARRTVLYDERDPTSGEAGALEAIALATSGEAGLDADAVWIGAPAAMGAVRREADAEPQAAQAREAEALDERGVGREEVLATRERALDEREAALTGRAQALIEEAASVAAKERALAERVVAEAERAAECSGREAEIEVHEREVAAREEEIAARARALDLREEEIAARARALELREVEEAARARALEVREGEEAARARALEVREEEIAAREREHAERSLARAPAERPAAAFGEVTPAEPRSRSISERDLDFDELEIELIDIMPPSTKESRSEAGELSRSQALADERLRQVEALQRALDDAEERLAALQAGGGGDGEASRGGADIALDRDRLREELARRTSDLQVAEEKAWQATEAAQKERIENVRLVAEVDRLREQVERSRGAEQERLREVESLGHELRRLEIAHAEVQGLLGSKAQRLDELEAEAEAGGADEADLQRRLRAKSGELELLRAREHAGAELVRRRERELDEANETIAQLRRTIDDYAAAAANLRGELVVIQVEVEQLQSLTPGLQQQIGDYRRKLKEREDEASELQRKLEEATAEQQHLRARLRDRKRELEEASGRRDALQVELEGIRAELVVCKRAMAQLEHTVSVTSGAAEGDVVSQELRAELAAQARRFAEELGRVEARSEAMLVSVRDRQRRAELEAKIRGDEQEYLLTQLDACEQRIWEMTDASDRSAARLAAGLAQYDKQKEQLEDLVHELEVTRNLLAEAESRVVDLERTLANERVRLARMGVETPVPEPPVDAGESGVWAPVPAFPEISEAPVVGEIGDGEGIEARLTLDDELLRLTDAILDGEPELASPMGVTPRSDDEYDRELEEMLASDDVMPAVLPTLGYGADLDDELLADVEEAMAESRAATPLDPLAASDPGATPTTETGIIIEILGEDEDWPDDDEGWPAADAPADEAPPLAAVAGEVDVSVIIDEVDESDASYIDIDIDEWSEAQRGRRGRMDTIRATALPTMTLGADDDVIDDEIDDAVDVDAPTELTTAEDDEEAASVVGDDDGIVIVDDEDDDEDIVGVEGWLGAVLPGDDADILADLVGVPADDDDEG